MMKTLPRSVFQPGLTSWPKCPSAIWTLCQNSLSSSLSGVSGSGSRRLQKSVMKRRRLSSERSCAYWRYSAFVMMYQTGPRAQPRFATVQSGER